MRSNSEFDAVVHLAREGKNNCEISRLTGVPRTTVRGWRLDGFRRKPDVSALDLARANPGSYCYLLGLYLGDGCISRSRRVWLLRVTLDSKYPGIIESCCQAMENLMIGQTAGIYRRSGCVDVAMYSKQWTRLFPQHAPGRKHERVIQLEPWQQSLVDAAPKEFIRGLIHSDGCRVVANDRGVASVRYHFSNRSTDILGLYCAALDALAIPWTRPSAYDVAVYRKAAVARLDKFIGPKR